MVPRKILKVETDICNLRHSGGKFEGILHTKIHNEYQFCTFSLHPQIHHFIFHRKKSMLVDFFPHRTFFPPVIFDFHFREISCFRDEFQALYTDTYIILCTKRGFLPWQLTSCYVSDDKENVTSK